MAFSSSSSGNPVRRPSLVAGGPRSLTWFEAGSPRRMAFKDLSFVPVWRLLPEPCVSRRGHPDSSAREA